MSHTQNAQDQFAEAERIYESLAEREESTDLEERDLFLNLALKVQPLLNYCTNELGGLEGKRGGNTGSNKATKKGSGKADSGMAAGESVRFRETDILVEGKTLKLLISQISDLKSQYGASRNEDAFVSLYTVLSEAIDAVAADKSKYSAMKGGPLVDAKKTELDFLRGFLQNERLHLSMQRTEDRLALCPADGHRERTHLLDSLLQDAEALCKLPGPDE